MDVRIRRRYNAVVEDVVIVRNVRNGPEAEQSIKQKLDTGEVEFEDNWDCQVMGDESTVEILNIEPLDGADDIILKNM